MMRFIGSVLAVVLCANSVIAQTPDARARQIVASAEFKAATAFLERDSFRYFRVFRAFRGYSS